MMPNNRNKIWRKIVVIGLISIVFSVTFNGSPVSAISDTSGPTDCPIQKRLEGWGNFMNGFIMYEGFLEYFKDIFVRNRCHQDDIDRLQLRLDALRKQIRKAFYTCDTERVTGLSKTYREIYIELFYLRKFIDYGKGAISLNKSVKSDLESIFVSDKKWYSGDSVDDFWALVKRIQGKYQIERYQTCSDDVWAELTDKWKEFKEFVPTSLEDIKKAGKEIVWNKKIRDRWAKINDVPPGSTASFWDDRVGFYLNDVPPEYGRSFFSGLFSDEELSDLSDEALENIPIFGSGTLDGEDKEKLQELSEREVSIQRYLKAIDEASEQHLNDINIAEMIAEYTFLYKDSSESLIDSFMSKLDREEYCKRTAKDSPAEIKANCKKGPPGLRDIIKETYPILEQAKSCSKIIRDRQCAN